MWLGERSTILNWPILGNTNLLCNLFPNISAAAVSLVGNLCARAFWGIQPVLRWDSSCIGPVEVVLFKFHTLVGVLSHFRLVAYL